MKRRLLAALAAALALGGLAVALARLTDPAVRSAEHMAGERWYRLMLNDEQVGYMRTDSRRDRRGQWRFTSDLRFVLEPGSPVRIRESLTFGAYPPFPLLAAEQWQQGPSSSEGTLIRRANGGYEAASLRDVADTSPRPAPASDLSGPASPAWQPLSWTYALTDYLEFEGWLLSQAPQPGATRLVSTLDFSRRAVVSRVFQVAGRNGTGYVIEHAAPIDPSRIQLDASLAPATMSLSGIFELQRASADRALAPRTALHSASYFVPTDRPLRNHQEIRRLRLEIYGDIAPETLWPDLLSADRRTLDLTTNPLSGRPDPKSALAETTTFPVSNPRIRSLARQAVAGAGGPQEQVAQLTGFVHRYLRYSEDTGSAHVMALLDDPRGDCTEYADLFTTLARALGIPSRTVFGLAYADGPPPAFRFHAWNEVFVQGSWTVVDPTWNQLEVDATHIPLPENTGASLALLTGGGDLRFVVREVVYR